VVSNGRQKCAEGSSAGDEPALLAEKLQGVPVVVDEKRVRGAQKTIELFSPDVIILDDGFQHRSLRRDCDVVLLTAEELIKPSFLLPAGYRREPFSSLNRADMVVITKCRDTDHFREAAEKLRGRFQAPVFGLRTAVAGIRRLGSGAEAGPESLRGKKIVAFSGIADAASFDFTLAELGANVLAHHRFKDHHWYTSGDLQGIKESFQALRADSLVTTEKDMVRIADTPDSMGQLPLFSIGIRSEMIVGEKELKKILGEIVSKRGT
jgi:tetraacyldisaccharide 4'-kinase